MTSMLANITIGVTIIHDDDRGRLVVKAMLMMLFLTAGWI